MKNKMFHRISDTKEKEQTSKVIRTNTNKSTLSFFNAALYSFIEMSA